MLCSNCGKEVGESLTSCPQCGTQVGSSREKAKLIQAGIAKNGGNLWGYFVGTIKEFVSFAISGRARRAEYWGFYLFYTIIYGIIGVVETLLVVVMGGERLGLTLMAGSLLAVPSYGLAIRRMHDVGKSAIYAFIPIYGFILACKDSEPGANKYGPNPKDC